MSRLEFYAKVRVGLLAVTEMYPTYVYQRWPSGRTIWVVKHPDWDMYIRRNEDDSWTWIS